MRPFAMERWQSEFENTVAFNLSESGVHPVTLGELLELAGQTGADDILLSYGQSNGSIELRRLIASLYQDATEENVLVTVGSAEANFVALWRLIRPGDEVACVLPNYMQAYGIAETFGARISEIHLREELAWQPDPDEIRRKIKPGTRLVILSNPNNPTGARLAAEPREALLRAAEAAGAWILADEVYAGAELDGQRTASFWGEYPRAIATGSLSKAYGLPGLRIGWLLAPPQTTAELWARTDYTTIATGALTDSLACLALAEPCRSRLLERARGILNSSLDTLQSWAKRLQSEQGNILTFLAPEAGAICFLRYHLAVNSSSLAERLRTEQDVLVVPGDHFDLDNYMRIGYGLPHDRLTEPLDRIARTLADLAGKA